MISPSLMRAAVQVGEGVALDVLLGVQRQAGGDPAQDGDAVAAGHVDGKCVGGQVLRIWGCALGLAQERVHIHIKKIRENFQGLKIRLPLPGFIHPDRAAGQSGFAG